MPKRRGQVFVNTWHGGGAYKIGVLTGTLVKDKLATLYGRSSWTYRERKTNFYLSSCKAFTDFTSDDWHADKAKYLPTGMPRNDFLLKSLSTEERSEIRNKILKKAGLEEGIPYILYAPTFRGARPKNHDLKLSEVLDVDMLIKACRERFGKDFKVLYREHLGCTADADSKYSRPDVVGISFYPDMQELLFIADILITDYSSSMWDFALLRRPGFLYVPDLEEYKENTGFFTPIDTWAFPYATSNAGLQELIAEYDEEKAMQKMEEHLDRLGSYERGNACEQVVSKLGL